MRRMTLLISADDTLWENNIYFEQTIERFLTMVEPFGYARGYARYVLNETERLNIRQHGYGVRSRIQMKTPMKDSTPMTRAIMNAV